MESDQKPSVFIDVDHSELELTEMTSNFTLPPHQPSFTQPSGAFWNKKKKIDDNAGDNAQSQVPDNIEVLSVEENTANREKKKSTIVKDLANKTEKLFQKGQEVYRKGQDFIKKNEKIVASSKQAYDIYRGMLAHGDYIGFVNIQFRSQVNEIKRQIKLKISQQVKDFFAGSKEQINAWIRQQVELVLVKILAKAKPKLKLALKQPGMYQSVQNLIDDIVDEIWPDIEEEILFQLKVKFDEPYIYQKPPMHPCWTNFPLCWIRRKYLYATLPYDRNIWQQMENPFWWIFLLISLFPYYGVQPFFYACIFLMIDKGDEYQLVNFILNYKKLQFFTQGVVSGVIGYVLFYGCIDYGKYTSNTDFSDCLDYGPGANVSYYADIPAFFSQILFLWIAYFLLPWSKPKGKPKFKYTDHSEPEEENCCCCTFNMNRFIEYTSLIVRGGRLKGFLIYDVITFVISVGVFLLVHFVGDSKEEWQIKSNFYFSKIIYGLLSFPFLIFAVPGVPLILTRSRATAYDAEGNTVPCVKVNKLPPPKDEEEDFMERGKFNDLLDEKNYEEDDGDQPAGQEENHKLLQQKPK